MPEEAELMNWKNRNGKKLDKYLQNPNRGYWKHETGIITYEYESNVHTECEKCNSWNKELSSWIESTFFS